MVAVPAVKPVTRPVVALTAVMLVSLLDQDPPVTVEVKADVPLTQMFWFPLSVPAVGAAVTVMVRVAIALAQPPVPTTVYVMVAVPAVKPVTRPVVALTVAMLVSLLDQDPPVVVDAKVVLFDTHIKLEPEIEPGTGGAARFKFSVMIESQSLEAGMVRVYIPAEVSVCEPKVKLSPWQMDTEMEFVALILTVRLRVMAESHPLKAGMVRL